MTQGIDYSGPLSTANRDESTNIRYGIIPLNRISLDTWYSESTPSYGDPCCPRCGGDATEYNEYRHSKFDHEAFRDSACDYVCRQCRIVIPSDEAFPEEPQSEVIDTPELSAFTDSTGDLWIVKSDYYTYAAFCSPCAPGACYLLDPLPNPDPSDAKCYCLSQDWFEEKNPCPYPVYRLSDHKRIYTPDSDLTSD